MSGGFSGVVRLSNVNDYIAPSQACVIPLKPTLEQPAATEDEQLVSTHSKKPKTDKPVVKVSISLADCLACAGCVTSAETVLIEEQSVQRAIEGLRAAKLGVVTVSASSLASICTARGWTMEEGARRVTEFFRAKGARVVLDASVVQSLALRECWQEMRERIEQREKGGAHRPLLVSACPGFACYAEKSHGALLMPLMSRTRSSQGVAGVLVKEYLPRLIAASSNGPSLSPADIYHVAVMPCFDRKLEASRPENTAADGSRHVDCVLGTAELNGALSAFLEGREEEESMEVDESPELARVEEALPEEITGFMRGALLGLDGNLSGGYVEYGIDRWSAAKGGAVRVEETKAASNLDVIRVFSTRPGEEEERPFVAARVYGFRNIQNMVRKLKTGKKELEYDLVEVMACPSGCANGGGQIRAATTQERNRVTEGVERLYSNLPRQPTTVPSIDEFRASIEDEKMRMDLKDVGATVNANLAW
ncbi:oxy-4 [Pristionchus pacificus]|nr:oxy-4 [Pristionchus pacificus]